MLVSSASIHSRFTQLILLAFVLIGTLYFYLPPTFSASIRSNAGHFNDIDSDLDPKLPPKANHPINQLIERGKADFRRLVSKETKNLHDAANAYRQRRGRQPPPGFDVWFEYATNNSAFVVEDFFDRIYDDLNPFWGVPAKQIREQANVFLHRISVRDGKVDKRTDTPLKDRPWMGLWGDMVESVAAYLPDVDLPINVMDESRIVVHWEEINEYMQKESLSRQIVPEPQLKKTYGQFLKELDKSPPPEFDPGFSPAAPYWQFAVVGCPPTSPARQEYIETDFTRPPPLSPELPKESFNGYVQNWTFAKSPCENPHLQGLHGSFVEPISISNTQKFIPLFGGSKLPVNNEILLPPAMYWTNDPFYSGGEEHGAPWKEKKDRLVWRGAASGGRNRDNNWTRFQRHRLVSMVNATSIRQVEDQTDFQSPNFILPRNGTFDLAAQEVEAPANSLSDWVATWSDAAVVHLLCFPDEHPPRCPYTDPYFFVEKEMPMKQQYFNKYLPDIDGNSFSGRYRGFLGSTSMPIKATIYQEWHDSRLVPWKHFVPMDNTFIDIYGIMEYFVGNKLLGLGGHDDEARRIALDGKDWAEKVLRKEDMSIYVFRLLLEYARLCDDDREKMGWAERIAPVNMNEKGLT